MRNPPHHDLTSGQFSPLSTSEFVFLLLYINFRQEAMILVDDILLINGCVSRFLYAFGCLLNYVYHKPVISFLWNAVGFAILPLWQNRCCDQRLSAVYVGAVHHVDSVIASHCCLRWPRLSTANFTGCCHSHYVTSNRCYLISTRSRSVNESSSSLAAASSDQWQPQNRMPPILPV